MTLAQYLTNLRVQCGVTQACIGAQGFVSEPFWIKLEGGNIRPSESMIDKLIAWLIADRYLAAEQEGELRNELLTLLYLSSPMPHLNRLAREHAASTPAGKKLLAEFDAATLARVPKQRGRPRGRKNFR